MTKNVKRPELGKQQIQRCHDLIDNLAQLHQETDPKLGKKSQKDKQEKALQALNKIGLLSGILTEWAENQIFGTYYKVAKSKDNWVDQENCDTHENELMWYGENIPDDVFSNESHVICERLAIGTILHNTFSKYGRMGWRMYLKECLYALNEGQVETLMQPMNTNQKGDAYDLQQLKWAAVKHVHRLVGESWKKTAAQQQLADSCGTTFEALRKWERECIKERDPDKSILEAIQFGAFFIQTRKKASPEITDSDLMAESVYWNKNTSNNAEEKHLKDMSYGVISVIQLCEKYPLDCLKDRLASAGLCRT